jgi:hypothetical protein
MGVDRRAGAPEPVLGGAARLRVLAVVATSSLTLACFVGCGGSTEEEAKALCGAGAAGVGAKLADKSDGDLKALAAAATALGAYACSSAITEYGETH